MKFEFILEQPQNYPTPLYGSLTKNAKKTWAAINDLGVEQFRVSVQSWANSSVQ